MPVCKRRSSLRGESVAKLSLRGVSKRFGHVEVIRDLSLEIPSGEFAVFLGPVRLRQVHPAAHDRRA